MIIKRPGNPRKLIIGHFRPGTASRSTAATFAARRARRALAVAVTAAAACLLALSASTAPARAGGVTGDSGPIFGEYGDCMVVNPANQNNGTPVELESCYNSGSVTWEVEPGPFGDTIHATGLENPGQGVYKCLDVSAGGTTDGTSVQIWDCQWANFNQIWVPLPDGQLVNPQSGKCLDVPGGSQFSQLQIWDCNPGSSNQIWEIPGQRQIAAGPVLNFSNGKCMDVRNGSTANGTAAQIYTCLANQNQQWTISPVSTVGDTISALGGSVCLDTQFGGAHGNGTPVGLYRCGMDTTDYWAPLPNGELVNTAYNLCLDDPNGSINNGTQLQLWTCSPGSHQDWATPILSGTP